MTMNKTYIVITIAGVACLGLFAADKKAPPSKDFVSGFEAGVRWGIIAKVYNPNANDLPTLTTAAKQLYWLMVVDESRSLIDAVTNNSTGITTRSQTNSIKTP